MQHTLASNGPAVTELNRRVFLKSTGMAAVGLSFITSGAVQAADAAPKTVALVRGPELGVKPHSLRVGDGAGGWTCQPAEFRFLHAPGSMLMPFGIVQMDNGEIALLGAICDEKQLGNNQTACAAFSSDRGST